MGGRVVCDQWRLRARVLVGRHKRLGNRIMGWIFFTPRFVDASNVPRFSPVNAVHCNHLLDNFRTTLLTNGTPVVRACVYEALACSPARTDAFFLMELFGLVVWVQFVQCSFGTAACFHG